MRTYFVPISLTVLLSACPVDTEPGDRNAATNGGPHHNTVANHTTVSNNTVANNADPQTNADPNTNSDPRFEDVTVELVAVEWGLFAGAPPAIEVAETVSGDGDVTRVQVEAGPGAYALRVHYGSQVVIDATANTADRLIAVGGDVTKQPFFLPAVTQLEVEVAPAADNWAASVVVQGAGAPVPIDSTAPLVDPGAWIHDELAAIADSADPGAQTVELMHALRERGGPIHTEAGVLFIAPAQDGEPAPQIRGTWNDFDADPASELRRVTPGLWARFIDVPPGRHEYKIYYPSGDTWVTDVSNPHIVWDGFDPGTIGSFNSVLRPQGARTVWLPDVDSPELQNERDVYVHLPASYDGSESYPVLYVHDGNESIVRSQFHLVADDAAAADARTEAILVFVALPSQNVRLDEYTMSTPGSRGDDYVSFLADTLVPRIDGSFRTRTERTARGLTGASLGGLISFWGAMQHPDVFGYTAGMSSSFFWDDEFVIAEIATRGCQNVVYYLDSGSPNDNFQVTQTMRDTLDGLGCDYDYVLEPGGQHDWAFWRGRFGGVLSDFADVHGG